MLYQELPRIDSAPLGKWGRWLAPGVVAAAGLTFDLLLLAAGHGSLAAFCAVAGFAGGGATLLRSGRGQTRLAPTIVAGPDFAIVGAALGLIDDPVALTDGAG